MIDLIDAYGIGGALEFFENMNKALKNDEASEKALKRAHNMQADAANKVEEHKREADQSLNKVINRKKAILSTHMSNFINIYQQIQTIDFRPGEGIIELKTQSMTPACVDSIQSMTVTALKPMSDKEALVTFLFKGLSGAIMEDSKRNLAMANSQLRAARAVNSQADNYIIAIDAIKGRADQVSGLLARFGVIFQKSIKLTDRIIKKNGINRLNYSKADREVLMTCVNIASAVKSVLDTPLLGEDGSVTQESLLAIQEGQKRLANLSEEVSI